MTESQTLCGKCIRTGGQKYIDRVRDNKWNVPKDILPCKFITKGIPPEGAEYVEHYIKNSPENEFKGCCIKKCPLFVDDESDSMTTTARTREPKFVCVEDGQVYINGKEISEKYGMSLSGVYDNINAKNVLLHRSKYHFIRISDIIPEYYSINPALKDVYMEYAKKGKTE